MGRAPLKKVQRPPDGRLAGFGPGYQQSARMMRLAAILLGIAAGLGAAQAQSLDKKSFGTNWVAEALNTRRSPTAPTRNIGST